METIIFTSNNDTDGVTFKQYKAYEIHYVH